LGGVRVGFWTSFGADTRGAVLRKSLEGGETVVYDGRGGERTATYLAMLDEKKDLHAAVADMKALEFIESPAKSVFEKASIFVFDGNPLPGTIETALERCSGTACEAFFEPTSVEKALRVVSLDLLPRINMMKPNLEELFAIGEQLGVHGEEEVVARGVWALMGRETKTRTRRLFVSMGSAGVLVVDEKGVRRFVGEELEVSAGRATGLLTYYWCDDERRYNFRMRLTFCHTTRA